MGSDYDSTLNMTGNHPIPAAQKTAPPATPRPPAADASPTRRREVLGPWDLWDQGRFWSTTGFFYVTRICKPTLIWVDMEYYGIMVEILTYDGFDIIQPGYNQVEFCDS